MSRIRFSDQVLSSEDVSAGNGVASRRLSYTGGLRSGGPDGIMGRSPSRRSLDNRGITYHKAPPSVAASDTSSAAGFRPSSRGMMLHHSSSMDYPGMGPPPLHRRGGLARSYAVDAGDFGGGVSALFPRSTQDYLDELEYRGSVGGNIPPESVTTSSPYSARSGDDSGSAPPYNPAAFAATPILKNGTLPRAHSRAGGSGGSPYGGGANLERGGGGGSRLSMNAAYASTDFGGGRPPSRAATAVPLGNGSVAGSLSSYGGSARNGGNVNGRPNGGGVLKRVPSRPQHPHRGGGRPGSGRITSNPMDEVGDVGGRVDFLPPPQRSTSTPVIATPHRPCCECNILAKMTGRDSGDGGQYPIAFLFSIFLLFSVLVVSGIMLYLRGGEPRFCDGLGIKLCITMKDHA